MGRLDDVLMVILVVLMGAIAVMLACGAVLLVAAMPHLISMLGGK